MSEGRYTLRDLVAVKDGQPRPRSIVLCGSTRFLSEFQEANLRETLAGKIVFTIGCDTKQDSVLALDEQDKMRLDLLHLWKIEAADEVLVLNKDGYIGESTRREVVFAALNGKPLSFLEPDLAPILVCMGCEGLFRCGDGGDLCDVAVPDVGCAHQHLSWLSSS